MGIGTSNMQNRAKEIQSIYSQKLKTGINYNNGVNSNNTSMVKPTSQQGSRKQNINGAINSINNVNNGNYNSVNINNGMNINNKSKGNYL